jgi:hypothetical protein
VRDASRLWAHALSRSLWVVAAVLVAQASLAANVTSAPTVEVQPAMLGRLFTTAEERARLDQLRRGEGRPDARATAKTTSPTAVKPRIVTGVVSRSDGRNTVWVNGEPRPAAAGEADRKQVGKPAQGVW